MCGKGDYPRCTRMIRGAYNKKAHLAALVVPFAFLAQSSLTCFAEKAKVPYEIIQDFLLCGKGDYPRCARMIRGAYNKKAHLAALVVPFAFLAQSSLTCFAEKAKVPYEIIQDFLLCGKGDSNSHTLSGATTSK